MLEDFTHRWSGWPGAICLDCGQEDPEELILGGYSEDEVKELRRKCPNKIYKEI